MRRLVVLLLLVAGTLTGCGRSSGPFTDGCLARISYHGTTFTEVGFSSHPVDREGRASVVACASRRHGPHSVEVSTIGSYPAGKVLAVRHGHTSRVFVADGLPDAFTQTLVDSRTLDAGAD